MFELTGKAIQPSSLATTMAGTDCGGFVSFEGWVRDWNEGRRVKKLCYEAYETLAVKEGGRILEEVYKKYPIRKICAMHRVGYLGLGEVAVWIGAAGKHRKEAFAACRFAIDEIKHRVPIWKKEFYEDGESQWVGCESCANQGHRSIDVCAQ